MEIFVRQPVTSTGVYLDGDGDWALVKDAQNRIFNDGTNLVLKSEDFSLSGSTTLAIDIEKIRLGSNATTTLTHGSTGTFWIKMVNLVLLKMLII